MPINILNNFKKKRGRINDMQVKSSTNSRKAKAPDQGQYNYNNIHDLYSDDNNIITNNMLFMSSRPEKVYKNYGLMNITSNDLSSIPLSLYNPVNYLRRRELGYNHLSKLQPLSLRFLLNSFVSTENDIYKCNDEEQLAIIPPFACRYNNGKNHRKLLAIADEIGNVRIINTEKEGEIELKTQWLAHENAIFDIAWSLDDKKLMTAGGDQTALLWDIETNKCISGFQGHVSSIKSIVFHNQNPFICASGAREGNIMIWDLRCTGTVNENGDYIHKPANIIRNAHVPLSNNNLRKKKDKTNQHIGVAAVHFLHKPGYLASAGTADGLIKFWDIRSNGSYLHRNNPVPVEVSIHSTHSKRPHGFSSLSLDSTGRYLFSACTDNSIYMYNTLNLGKPVYRFTSPTYKCSTFYIKTSISPDNRFIASGSSDNHVYIWDITAPHRAPVKLKGHENEVTAVSWCPIDIKQMVTCSDDTSIRIWNMNKELEEKCMNDLYLKTTWGHVVEDVTVETSEDTPNIQVNKENISSNNNSLLDSTSSPTTSFFNFPNTISYSYDSNDSPCSSSPLSRFKYHNNAILLDDEASTSSTPTPLSTSSSSSSTIINSSSSFINRPIFSFASSSSSSSSTSTSNSNLINDTNLNINTNSNSNSNSNNLVRSISTVSNPFYFPQTPTKDATTPSKLVNDSPLSSSITDYFSTLSTRSPMPTIPPPKISNSSSKQKQTELPLTFLYPKNNSSSISFIMPNEKSSSSSSSKLQSSSSSLSSTLQSFSSSSSSSSSSSLASASTLSSFSSSPLSKKVFPPETPLTRSKSIPLGSTSSIPPSTASSSTSSSFPPSSPKITRVRHTSSYKKSSGYYNQSTLQKSFSSLSNPNSNANININTNSNSNANGNYSLSLSSSLSSSSSTLISPSTSTSHSASSSTSSSPLNLNSIPKSSSIQTSTSTSASTSKSVSGFASPIINIVSPPSSPCTSAPTSPVPKRKRTLMDYFSPNTNTNDNNKKKKKKKAKAVETDDEESESDEL
ncbi:WD40 repeat-like protein [Anaeromyces robustus]|uniref:WD40 repeat-like protein n=1 Tax=Anaeromyces robustus TaxID=1754192 RepID=A0A1Y1VTX4_9FUNG|nr:WD40 repeat-like protein [Anaeromyces robustus]|eukprot:ORX64749.1 WD40 repeat-like protein [Anaeromyces robustus]